MARTQKIQIEEAGWTIFEADESVYVPENEYELMGTILYRIGGKLYIASLDGEIEFEVTNWDSIPTPDQADVAIRALWLREYGSG